MALGALSVLPVGMSPPGFAAVAGKLPAGSLGDVSCSGTKACMAVGFEVTSVSGTYSPIAARFNGTRWTPASLPSGSTIGLTSVSCATPTWCMAVGTAALSGAGQVSSAAYIWNGTGWSAVAFPSAAPVLQISCPSPSFCAGIGGGTSLYTWNGSSWASESISFFDPATNFASVSCGSPTSCIAVGVSLSGFYPFFASSSNAADLWNGTSWNTITPPSATTSDSLTTVSCASSTFCLAGDGGSQGLIWNGSSWTATTPVPGEVLSCATPTACVTDSVGQSVGRKAVFYSQAWNGVAWRPVKVAPGVTAESSESSLACVSSSFCLEVSSSLTASQIGLYNGKSWQVQQG